MEPKTALPWKQGRHDDVSLNEIRTVDTSVDYIGMRVCKASHVEDAAYIVEACNAYPELSRRVLELEKERDELKHDMLRGMANHNADINDLNKP